MRGIHQVHSDELEQLKTRLTALLAAELEILTKGQEVSGEDDTGFKRANLKQVQTAIATVRQEIKEIESRDDKPDSFGMSKIIL